MAPISAHSLEIASPIATISSASTDGTPSASVFEISVQSSVLPTGLTTTTDFSLSLTLRPHAADITKNVSVYTVIVASNQFFKLEPDGSYAPWDGAAETLTPFVTDQMLSSTQTLTLLDGTMAEAAGISDRLVVIVGSDFSRTPYYNSAQGKEHHSIGSYIVMEKGVSFTNRVVDGSDEGHNTIKFDPKTLQPSGFETKMVTSHVHSALREYLGLASNDIVRVFPLNNLEEFNFFS
jgi:hypothetical protein